MAYGWLITEDLLDDGEAGISGPPGLKDEMLERLKKGKGKLFRMSDDDGEVYYKGRFIGDNNSDEFEPLDDFGMPNAGCVSIEYYEHKKGWVMV